MAVHGFASISNEIVAMLLEILECEHGNDVKSKSIRRHEGGSLLFVFGPALLAAGATGIMLPLFARFEALSIRRLQGFRRATVEHHPVSPYGLSSATFPEEQGVLFYFPQEISIPSHSEGIGKGRCNTW